MGNAAVCVASGNQSCTGGSGCGGSQAICTILCCCDASENVRLTHLTSGKVINRAGGGGHRAHAGNGGSYSPCGIAYKLGNGFRRYADIAIIHGRAADFRKLAGRIVGVVSTHIILINLPEHSSGAGKLLRRSTAIVASASGKLVLRIVGMSDSVNLLPCSGGKQNILLLSNSITGSVDELHRAAGLPGNRRTLYASFRCDGIDCTV